MPSRFRWIFRRISRKTNGVRIKTVLLISMITFLILFNFRLRYRHVFHLDFSTRVIETHVNSNNKCEMNHIDDDWLYRRKLIYNNSAAASDHWTVVNPNHRISPSHLRSYSLGAVANCFDSIRTSCQSKFDDVLRFVFIGDSRIRNQFFNFVKFLPDYDLKFEPILQQVGIESVMDFHIDRNVSSNLIGLHVSFLWRPRLNEEFIDEIEGFIDSPPYIVIMGLGSHHLLKHIIDNRHHHNLEIFEQRMKQFLLPAFQRLAAAGTQLVWMSQFPQLPDNKEPELTNGTVYTESLEVVDGLTRRLLKDSGVKFWDSGNPPVEENVRACIPMNGALKRDPYIDQFSHVAYFKCHDLLHPSFVSISYTIQILLNHICNRHIVGLPHYDNNMYS